MKVPLPKIIKSGELRVEINRHKIVAPGGMPHDTSLEVWYSLDLYRNHQGVKQRHTIITITIPKIPINVLNAITWLRR